MRFISHNIGSAAQLFEINYLHNTVATVDVVGISKLGTQSKHQDRATWLHCKQATASLHKQVNIPPPNGLSCSKRHTLYTAISAADQHNIQGSHCFLHTFSPPFRCHWLYLTLLWL